MKNVLAKIKQFVKYAAYVVVLMEAVDFLIKGCEKIAAEKPESDVQ